MPFHVFQQTQQVQDLAISSELVEFLSSSGSDVVISRNLLVNEDVFLNQDLQVNGTTTIQGPCSVNGTTTINGSCSADSIGSTGAVLTLRGPKVHMQHPTTSERYLEIGNDTANTTYIDFHSAEPSGNDFSARIKSTGGTTTSASGTLTLEAANINPTGVFTHYGTPFDFCRSTTSTRRVNVYQSGTNQIIMNFFSSGVTSGHQASIIVTDNGSGTSNGNGSMNFKAKSFNFEGYGTAAPILQINGTTINPTAAEYNTLAGATPGTAVASKTLVCDASTNIAGLSNVGAKMFVQASTTTSIDVTLSDSFSVYIVNTSAAAKHVRLPAGPASFTGRMWTVIRADTGTTNNLVINGETNNVTHNGSLGYNNPSNAAYKMFTVFCDGSKYYSW